MILQLAIALALASVTATLPDNNEWTRSGFNVDEISFKNLDVSYVSKDGEMGHKNTFADSVDWAKWSSDGNDIDIALLIIQFENMTADEIESSITITATIGDASATEPRTECRTLDNGKTVVMAAVPAVNSPATINVSQQSERAFRYVVSQRFAPHNIYAAKLYYNNPEEQQDISKK